MKKVGHSHFGAEILMPFHNSEVSMKKYLLVDNQSIQVKLLTSLVSLSYHNKELKIFL